MPHPMERHCAFFNPMYLQSRCDECGKQVGIICANERQRSVCLSCHRSPTLWERFILWRVKRWFR
jgi:hypothetical protein